MGGQMTTTQVSCRVPIEVAEALFEQAKREDRSLSNIVGRVLKEYVEKQKK